MKVNRKILWGIEAQRNKNNYNRNCINYKLLKNMNKKFRLFNKRNKCKLISTVKGSENYRYRIVIYLPN